MITLEIKEPNDTLCIKIGTEENSITVSLTNELEITGIMRTFETYIDTKAFIKNNYFKVFSCSAQEESILRKVNDMINVNSAILNPREHVNYLEMAEIDRKK